MTLPLHRLPTLDHLKGFVATARHLSFTRAGEELFLSQSAVSRQVQTLEAQLGAPLFVRSTRRLRLTPQGELLYRSASEMLARLGAVAQEIGGAGQRPHVTVSATIGFAALWLVPRLSAFQDRQPEIGVRVSADNRRVDLEREEVDVAIRYAAPSGAPADSRKLFDEALLPVASPGLAAALPAGPRLCAENLPALTLLAFDDGSDYPALRWESWLAPLAASPAQARGVLQFNHYDQAIAAALAGQGVAIGREPLIRAALAEGRLRPLGPRLQAPDGRAYYLLRAANSRRPAVDRFIDWLCAAATESAGSVDSAAPAPPTAPTPPGASP